MFVRQRLGEALPRGRAQAGVCFYLASVLEDFIGCYTRGMHTPFGERGLTSLARRYGSGDIVSRDRCFAAQQRRARTPPTRGPAKCAHRSVQPGLKVAQRGLPPRLDSSRL